MLYVAVPCMLQYQPLVHKVNRRHEVQLKRSVAPFCSVRAVERPLILAHQNGFLLSSNETIRGKYIGSSGTDPRVFQPYSLQRLTGRAYFHVVCSSGGSLPNQHHVREIGRCLAYSSAHVLVAYRSHCRIKRYVGPPHQTGL